jgi:diguanylate cyclase (GGDEF)-like protein
MYIDPVQFLIVCCCVVTMLSTLMIMIWLQDRTAKWLLWISAVLIFGGISLILFLLEGTVPRAISIGLGTSTFIFAFHLVWTAMRVFEGRRVIWLPVLVALPCWIGWCMVPGSLDSLAAASIVHSVLGALGVGGGAFELWRGRSQPMLARWVLMVLFGSVALFFGARLPFIAAVPFPFGIQSVQLSWTATFVLSLVCAAVALAVFSLLLAKERAEMDLRRFALTDLLTGLPNRRAFAVDVAKAARRQLLSEVSYCLIMLDLDSFKAINDKYGHHFGDGVLERFAEATRPCLRAGDALYRIGGEEFCCVLLNTEENEAVRVAEAMRVAFRSTVIMHRGYPVRLSVSAGIASSREAGADPVGVQALADEALYRAKRLGRDRTAVGSREPPPDQDVEWAA